MQNYQLIKCSYCGDKVNETVDCDGCGLENLCSNCYDVQVDGGGNLCGYCTGLYCPPPTHPDNNWSGI